MKIDYRSPKKVAEDSDDAFAWGRKFKAEQEAKQLVKPPQAGMRRILRTMPNGVVKDIGCY